MIVDKNYIVSRINFLLKEKAQQVRNTNDSKKMTLFRIKYFFPSWLRKIIFSPFNPIYAMYWVKKNIKRSSHFFYLHPMIIDFISYCFENEINFNTLNFFPPEDDILIQKHIDNRIESVITEYVNKKPISHKDYIQFMGKLNNGIKKKNGFYSFCYEDHCYNLLQQDGFSYTVFGCHYGLKFLPIHVRDYIVGKDFLDIGALSGDASIMFLQYEPRQIYAYEPVTSSYQMLLDTIKLQKSNKIHAIKKGIGDKETTMEIHIDDTNAGANTLLQNLNIMSNSAVEKISITTIDKECTDKKIGLIKMDIEGFEYYAVKGGLETIKRDKPVLLISIYHTGKDFFEIPPLIKSYVPEYKFRYLDIDPHSSIADKIIAGYIE
jgi:FkbM family methyltransferase